MAKRKNNIPVKKNEEVIVTCEDLTSEGNGVAKINQYPIFIPYLLPGEQARVKIVKVNKTYSYGKLITLLTRSDSRVEPPCNVFYRCGGCQLQHMDYELQLEMKRNHVINVLQRIGKLENVPVHPVLGMDNPWYYRNKMQMPVGEKDGELITGFYRERSHDIIDDMDTCLIQQRTGDDVVRTVREIANKLQIKAYDEKTHRGTLRHIIVRTAYGTNETMIILVTRTKTLPHEAELVRQIVERCNNIISIIHQVNLKRTNVIMGEKERIVFGRDHMIDRIGHLQFKLSPKSFFQVNPEQTEKLYDQALTYAQVSKDDVVIDAYCGIGSISLFLAEQAKKVYGVEIVPDAVRNARENARLNNIDNVEFITGKAEEVFQQWKRDGIRTNVIVVDPPRKGCDATLLQAIIDMAPERVVYVSCNPATLARDLRILKDGGFRTQEVQPVDMFSQTHHVECVALMSRVDE